MLTQPWCCFWGTCDQHRHKTAQETSVKPSWNELVSDNISCACLNCAFECGVIIKMFKLHALFLVVFLIRPAGGAATCPSCHNDSGRSRKANYLSNKPAFIVLPPVPGCPLIHMKSLLVRVVHTVFNLSKLD